MVFKQINIYQLTVQPGTSVVKEEKREASFIYVFQTSQTNLHNLFSISRGAADLPLLLSSALRATLEWKAWEGQQRLTNGANDQLHLKVERFKILFSSLPWRFRTSQESTNMPLNLPLVWKNKGHSITDVLSSSWEDICVSIWVSNWDKLFPSWSILKLLSWGTLNI